MSTHDFHGGYIKPEDRVHEEKYPLSLVLPTAPATVEKMLPIPVGMRTFYNQGSSSACTGFSTAMLCALYNSPKRKTKRYDGKLIWCRATQIDNSASTDCGRNTGAYLRVAFDVIRTEGLAVVTADGTDKPVDLDAGISENRWAQSVDEMRAAIANGDPVVMGSDWFAGMSNPTRQADGSYVLTRSGALQGGHAYTLMGASDARQAFFFPNSWGVYWPAANAPGAWIPYRLVEELLADDGEAGVAVDRPKVQP